MPLDDQQAEHYLERFTIWRSTEPPPDADGEPNPRVWAIVAEDVPCFLETTPSNFTLNGFGLMEEDMIFTLDLGHFAPEQCPRNGDELKMTSSATVGIQGTDLVGGFWRVRGNPKIKGWMANKGSAVMARLEEPSEGVN